jgi:branched-chain amino acid transport system substrate-binding protein
MRARTTSVIAGAAALLLAAGGCTSAGKQNEARVTLTIAVDLPSVGSARDASQDTMDALNLYLRQHANGKYAVNLARFDTADGTSAWSESACGRLATDHAATAGLVAVIGPFNDGCAKAELPTLNQADAGPLVAVSHASTAVGLTADLSTDEAHRYFPTGKRSFGRMLTNESAHGSAAAQYAAQQLKVTRCLVLDDGEATGTTMAASFVTAAKAAGIDVIGRQSWRRSDSSYLRLFSDAWPANPDCVVLAGHFDNNGAQVVRDKVDVLGDNTKVKLLALDGFVGYPEFLALRDAAGAYVTFPGLTTAAVKAAGGAGATFVGAFNTEYGHDLRGSYTSYPLYAVAALQVLLAAIEKSDGSRAGVRDALLGGDGVTVAAADSVLGHDLHIVPATGDVAASDISVQLVVSGKLA